MQSTPMQQLPKASWRSEVLKNKSLVINTVCLWQLTFCKSWCRFTRTRGCRFRQSRTYFGIFLIVVLLGSDPPANQVISHRVCESKVVIPSGCHISVLDQRKVEMSVEVLLQLWDILDAGEASHGNLLLPVMVGQRLRHSGTSCCSSALWVWENVNSKAQIHSRRGTHTAGSPSAI